MFVVAQPVDNKNIVRPQKLDDVVKQCRILAGQGQRDSGAGDSAAGQDSLDSRVHESHMPPMADRRRFNPLGLFKQICLNLGRHGSNNIAHILIPLPRTGV